MGTETLHLWKAASFSISVARSIFPSGAVTSLVLFAKRDLFILFVFVPLWLLADSFTYVFLYGIQAQNSKDDVLLL
jgi:hypothetical protein